MNYLCQMVITLGKQFPAVIIAWRSHHQKPLGARIQRTFGKWKSYARSATTTETVLLLFRPNTKKLKASSYTFDKVLNVLLIGHISVKLVQFHR